MKHFWGSSWTSSFKKKIKNKFPSLAFRTGRNQMCLVGEHVWTATTEHTCRIYFWVPRYGFLYLTWPSFGKSAFSITEINTAPPWPLAFHFLKSIHWHFWPSWSSCSQSYPVRSDSLHCRAKLCSASTEHYPLHRVRIAWQSLVKADRSGHQKGRNNPSEN